MHCIGFVNLAESARSLHLSILPTASEPEAICQTERHLTATIMLKSRFLSNLASLTLAVVEFFILIAIVISKRVGVIGLRWTHKLFMRNRDQNLVL